MVMFGPGGREYLRSFPYLLSAFLQHEITHKTFELTDHPIWILGQQYDGKDETALLAAKEDVLSRVWLTYRYNFPTLPSSYMYTSDKGWGCMLRCGQMLLAEAMIRRHLGRCWRWSKESREKDYLQVLSMFNDDINSAFSLHVMVTLGKSLGKEIGEWYGPNTVAHVIKMLPEFDIWNKFVVVVTSCNMFFVKDSRKLSKASHPNGWDPMLIIVPHRLGVNNFNDQYIEYLKSVFRVPQCLGVLGGTPSHALFLIGYVGNEVIYLDPHTNQESIPVNQKSKENEIASDESYHCNNTPRMNFDNLDPSLAVCFLCNSQQDFTDLVSSFRNDEEIKKMIDVMDEIPFYLREDTVVTSFDKSPLDDSLIDYEGPGSTADNKEFMESDVRKGKEALNVSRKSRPTDKSAFDPSLLIGSLEAEGTDDFRSSSKVETKNTDSDDNFEFL